MDSFPQEPEDVKSKLPGPSGLLLSRVTSAPEPRRYDGPSSFPFDLTPLKRDSPMDRPYQRSATELSSPYARQFWPSATSSPHQDDNTELPDKRPRLEYIPERVDAGADMPGGVNKHVCTAVLRTTLGFIRNSVDSILSHSLATMSIRSSMNRLHRHPQIATRFSRRSDLVTIATTQRAWLWTW